MATGAFADRVVGDRPAADYPVCKRTGGHALALTERQFVVDQQIERVAPVEQRRTIAPMMVKGVWNGAGAFLRNAEVIQRVGVSVVGIERQTAIGPRSQGQEAGLVVRIGEASAPVDRTYLRISQRHRPGHEVRFQKEL